jgi:lysozyme
MRLNKHLLLLIIAILGLLTAGSYAKDLRVAPKVKQPIIEFLKAKEGLRKVAYKDAVGVLTIGYGHTQNVSPGMKITEEIAEKLLRKDTRRFEKYVYRKIDVPLEWYKYGALVSWSFNLGYRITNEIEEAVETGNDAKVVYKLKLYVYAGGRVLRGLVIRRKEEAEFYLGNEEIIRKYSKCD